MVEVDILRSRFVNRVAKRLANANLTVTDLAALSGLSALRVQRLLEGQVTRLTLNDMDKIAAVVGASVYELIAPGEG